MGPPPPASTTLTRFDALPGVVIAIVGVSGGTGPNGNLKVGDTPAVRFTVKTRAGATIPLGELVSGSIYLSGPTTRYQRVIASQSDLRTRATVNPDGSYTYAFAAPIPATYLAPLNDSPAFDAGYAGELTGQPLAPGTYTVAIQAYKNFTIDGVTYRDAGNAVLDFLFDSATTLEKREVVTEANCNACHTDLRAHGGSRNELGTCVLCHVAGSEDRNVSTIEGGTPGVSVDFGVMIHKIHSAAHLPSVVGVGVQSSGDLDYSVAPRPYRMIVNNNRVVDLSDFALPVMPSAYRAFVYDQSGSTFQGTVGNGPMPRDQGWSSLPAAAKRKEDHVRSGVIACAKCHGDPDGPGPLPAPAQGARHETVATRFACDSCHDDIDWTKSYVSNGQTMAPQANDASCAVCHPASGGPLAVREAHLHPYNNPALNTGVNLKVLSLAPGSADGGRHQPGDALEVTFQVTNNADAGIPVMSLTRLQAIAVGPTSNRQVVLPPVSPYDFAFRKSAAFTGSGTISAPSVVAGAARQTVAVVFNSATSFDVVGDSTAPLANQVIGSSYGSQRAVTYQGLSFTVTQGTTQFAADDRWYVNVEPPAASYTLKLPVDLALERVGVSTGAADVFTVANPPLLWGFQTVMERTAVMAGSTLRTGSAALQHYVVVDTAALSGVAVGDQVVIGDGNGDEEYAEVGRIQTTHDVTGADLGQNDLLWFTTPLRWAHAQGAAVQEVVLTVKRERAHYVVTNAAAGTFTAVAGQFTAGNRVVVSYRTWGRFGWRRAPGDTVQALYPAPMADSDEVDASWGDWKGLPLLDGTYTVGLWANKDFTVTPAKQLTTTTAWDNWATDNTTYRMMSPPATKDFLFGATATLQTRQVISSGASCNACHDDVAAHGFGRRGLETCLLCHNVPGLEDAPKYSFSSWYVGPTPGESMDFRKLLHRIHAGKELRRSHEVNGAFLGVPYRATYDTIGFPAFIGGVAECTRCHGASNTAWQEPAPRSHPLAPQPTRIWASACSSCHDSLDAEVHFLVQTYNGYESCGVCHGKGREYSVEVTHRVR